MIDAKQPEAATTIADKIAPRMASSPREQILTWLVMVISLIAAIQVFRTVALQLQVNQSLDQLYHDAGQALPVKS